MKETSGPSHGYAGAKEEEEFKVKSSFFLHEAITEGGVGEVFVTGFAKKASNGSRVRGS